MYKITFDSQPSHCAPDVERDSIEFSREEYLSFPELPENIFDNNCKFEAVMFLEQVRHPKKEFLAIRIYNPEWKQNEDKLINPWFYWFLVCLDVENDVWIAFKYWDEADWAEAYGSTVSISEPRHGKLYRLNAKCKNICKVFYE